MRVPTFAEQQQAWSSPPVDDIGYLPSADLLEWSDQTLLDLIDEMGGNRYGGWRNYEGRWRRVLKLDETTDKDVLDYGCGVGLEALQYAQTGNRVSLADISSDNLAVASRVLALHRCPAVDSWLITSTPREDTETFDVIHCAGVLHHIPDPIPIVQHMARWLRPKGELRLMLYSDQAWRKATGTEPPESVSSHEHFERYVRYWDAVGNFADWYDQRRLRDRFGNWFRVDDYEPLTKDGSYVGAVLSKR